MQIYARYSVRAWRWRKRERMAFCAACGNSLAEGERFCRVCGRDSTSGAPPTQATGTQATPAAPVIPAKTSGKAITSLLCGLLFFIPFLFIVAIVFGHLALSEIKRSAGRLKGEGLAIAGLVLGYGWVIFIPIILIIAAIAIPNLLRSRMTAYEASAVGSLRAINTSAVMYSSIYGNGFPPSIAALGTPVGGGNAAATCNGALLIAEDLTTGTKSGYVFAYTAGNLNTSAPAGCASPGGNSYTLTATPQQVGTTGQRMFYTDQTGTIRFDPTGAGASATSSPLN